jgi:hypothetical protein
MKNTKMHLCGVVVMAALLVSTSCVSQIPPVTDAGPDGVLFEIGEVDHSRHDYKQTGWEGIQEYEYIIGVNSLSDGFPSHLYVPSLKDIWDSTAVVHLRIKFKLSKSFEQVILRIARAGDETTIVNLDNEHIYEVTSAMLGSDEHSNWGSYDLSLGALEKGIRNIEFSVADDGKGNGRYGWDAIILYAVE